MGCVCHAGVFLTPLSLTTHPSAASKSGFAVHMYTANTSMEDSCLANADGDMLIVPQQGEFINRPRSLNIPS